MEFRTMNTLSANFSHSDSAWCEKEFLYILGRPFSWIPCFSKFKNSWMHFQTFCFQIQTQFLPKRNTILSQKYYSPSSTTSIAAHHHSKFSTFHQFSSFLPLETFPSSILSLRNPILEIPSIQNFLKIEFRNHSMHGRPLWFSFSII